MRRLPAVLLATTLAVPLVSLLPTVRLSTARPVPVHSSLSGFALSGVDGAALASTDDGQAAAASADQAATAIPDGQGTVIGGGGVRPFPGVAPSGTAPSATAPKGTSSPGAPWVAPAAGASSPRTWVLRLPWAVAGAGAPGGGDRGRPLVLTAARRTASFASVGVTWDLPPEAAPQPNPVVVVRTHSGHGWTAWTALDVEIGDADESGAGGAQRGGTAPLWVGPSDGVQVRVDAGTGPRPTGLRVVLVNPGSSPYDSQVGVTPPGSAAAQAGQPSINLRAAWGADETRVRAAPTVMPGIAAVVIHHTADTNNYTAAQVPAMIRSDYAYHLSRGWNDIGYNFLVDRFGRIWEGRRGGIALAVQGAHAGGFNYLTFGVAVIGNDEVATPSTAALGALERLIAWKFDPRHIDPMSSTVLTASSFSGARWRAGTAVRLPAIMGHRDVDYTACPGRRLYPYLPRIRSAVARLMGAALVTPGISALSGPAGGTGPTVTARVLQTQSWRFTVAECTGAVFARVDGGTLARRVAVASWNGRRGWGMAGPGAYRLVLDSRNRTSLARPLAWSYVVTAPPPGPALVGPATEGSGGVVPIPPVRLLDSRTGPALATGPGGRVDVQVTGRGGIPVDGALAVVLRVTAFCPSASTSLVAWPAGRPQPSAVSLAVPARGIRTVTAVVPVGVQGKVSIANSSGATGLLVDAVGYTAAAGVPVLPVPNTRILDATPRLAPGASRSVSLPTIAGISPDRMTAVIAQVRLRGAAAAGSVEITGLGERVTGLPTARYEAGADTVTLAVLRPGPGGLLVTNTGTEVGVVIDVIGLAVADSQAGPVTSVPATRVYDSRSPGAGGGLAAGATRVLTLAGGDSPAPRSARAALVSLSATAGTAPATATLWPTGSDRPERADLALGRRGSAANLVLVPLSADGTATLGTVGGLSSVAVDVVGYLT